MKVVLCSLVLVFLAFQVTPSASRSHTKSKQNVNDGPWGSNSGNDGKQNYNQGGPPYSSKPAWSQYQGNMQNQDSSSSEEAQNSDYYRKQMMKQGNEPWQGQNSGQGMWPGQGQSGYQGLRTDNQQGQQQRQQLFNQNQNSEGGQGWDNGQWSPKRPISPLRQTKGWIQKYSQNGQNENQSGSNSNESGMPNYGRKNNQQNSGEQSPQQQNSQQSRTAKGRSRYGDSSPKNQNSDESQSFEIQQANWTPVKHGSQEIQGRFVSNQQKSRAAQSNLESNEHSGASNKISRS